MPLLHPGDTFPRLTLTVPGGETVTVPEAFAGQFGVLLFYRGSWCPYCNAQLRAFQRGRRPDRSLRQSGPGVPAVRRLRPRPGGQGRGQRLLQRGHRPAGPPTTSPG